MSDSIQYYSSRAKEYFDETFSADLSAMYERFLSRIPDGGLILDAGCGSARDAQAFLNRGYRVRAFDGCAELVEIATQQTGIPIQLRTFSSIEEVSLYDGIWACASLLHVPAVEMPETLGRLWQALKPGGALYVSFKSGEGERLDGMRRFTDATSFTVSRWLDALPGAERFECWESEDVRPAMRTRWVNAIVSREPVNPNKLVTGGASPFLPHLRRAIAEASEIDIAVAFVKTTGLLLLLPDLQDALASRKVRVRFITSDYLDVTDPDALRLLLLLRELGGFIRVFESAGGSFHMKAYLFARFSDDGMLRGQAFIGSSNISKLALANGLEWNYRIDYPEDPGYLEARNRFEEIFRHPQTRALTNEWIESYRRRRLEPNRDVAPGSTEREPPPTPTSVQEAALAALDETRQEGFRRGLVVMATGLGKTWLAAFDCVRFGARKILFVAHREEILAQAAETFIRIRPDASVGFYAGESRESGVDILCASVQTLGKAYHLDRFSPLHFDYIVVDEFHHASAPTYRRLLAHFQPKFLLGLTATPDRTDQADILSLCDDNLVFSRGLAEGVKEEFLVPFHYYGIFDDHVDYREIPWRNGRFDPEQLSAKLATLARARHAWEQWKKRKQSRCLAFCVSIRHADFMAQQFQKLGVRAASVHGQSQLNRRDALDKLHSGELEVIFSVDLFNEGIDLPHIDTVMLLRPTESRILFLQQIGRGLRIAPGKTHLVILDFIGNHRSFLANPQALFGVNLFEVGIARFLEQVESGTLSLPPGCFANFDLQLIDFLRSLDTKEPEKEYALLKDVLGRRPTILEFHRSGASLPTVKKGWGSWFQFVDKQGDLELELTPAQLRFLAGLETTRMSKSFKMILLEAFQELDGWRVPPRLETLVARSWEVMQRRPSLFRDLPESMRTVRGAIPRDWSSYWKQNPVDAWLGRNTSDPDPAFVINNDRLEPVFTVEAGLSDSFSSLVQEIIDYRLAGYDVRTRVEAVGDRVISIGSHPSRRDVVALPYFPNLQIACGHFRTGRTDSEEHRYLGPQHGKLDPSRHFIAQAAGPSMDGGKNPIRDGDYLLLERITPTSAGSLTGSTVVIERDDVSGDTQYLLRSILKSDGQHVLRANNPDRARYPDIFAEEGFRTVARLRQVLDPLEMALGRSFMREEIPPMFGETFNTSVWQAGHIVLNEKKQIVLLVTLSKRGRIEAHRYQDHWIDNSTFHWQSQNQTSPTNKRGNEIVNHSNLGFQVHLFIREEKLLGGKAAPFVYYGLVDYVSHQGSQPMSVIFSLQIRKM